MSPFSQHGVRPLSDALRLRVPQPLRLRFLSYAAMPKLLWSSILCGILHLVGPVGANVGRAR